MLKGCKKTGHQGPRTSIDAQGWQCKRLSVWVCGCVLFVLSFTVTGRLWADPQEDARLHQEAKIAIYQKQWHRARSILREIENRFPESTFRTEAFYWTAYTLEKISAGPGEAAALLEKKKDAIHFINRLLEVSPRSPWHDDAQILRVHIATDLTLMGKKEFKNYILEAAQSDNEDGLEQKMVALDALLRVDRKVGMELLVKAYLKSNDPDVHQNIIFILNRFNEEKTIRYLLSSKSARGNVQITESDCIVYSAIHKIEPLRARHRIEPEYPREALQEALVGTVQLKVMIDRYGRVVKVEALGTSHPLFRDAAVKAVKLWQYRAFSKNERRNYVSCVVTFKFNLSPK